MEILILCNQNDGVAISLHQKLLGMGQKASIVTAEELQYAISWDHKLDSNGKCATEIILQNKETIRSKDLKAVWNRIRYFPMAHFKNETDRQYAQNEMYALFFSFLKSVDFAAIKPLGTSGLSIMEENLLYLKHQAIKAGLNVLDHQFTTSPRWQSPKNMIPVILYKQSTTTFHKKAVHLVWQNQPVMFMELSKEISVVWIAGEKILGNKIILQKEQLKKLSENLKKDLLEIHFVKAFNGFKVSFINSYPAYAPDDVINSLATQLIKKTGSAI